MSSKTVSEFKSPILLISIVYEDIMVWKPGKLQSHKTEVLCLIAARQHTILDVFINHSTQSFAPIYVLFCIVEESISRLFVPLSYTILLEGVLAERKHGGFSPEMTPLPWLLVPPAHEKTTDQAQFEPATMHCKHPPRCSENTY